MKKIIAAICAMACILGSLAGCGKQEAAPTEAIVPQVSTEAAETTAPQISEENQLILELMENYLNREQPSDVFAAYQFGMNIKGKDLPVAQFENYRYTKNGETFYKDSMDDNGLGSVCSAYHNTSEERKYVYEQSLENPLYFYQIRSDELYYLKTLFRDQHGVIRLGEPFQEMDYLITSDAPCTLFISRDAMACGFSALPKHSFYNYVMELLENPSDLQNTFHLDQTSCYKDQRNIFSCLDEKGRLDENSQVNTDRKEIAGEQNCYAVSFTADSQYFNANVPKVMDQLFQQGFNTYVDGYPGAPNYNKRVPYTRTRLDDGPIEVTLYFDQETHQCIAEKIDASACAKSMISYINSLGWTESTDDSFVTQRSFAYGNAYTLPVYEGQDCLQENYQAYDNKIIAKQYHTGDGLFDVLKLDPYQIKTNMHDALYEIWDGHTMVATVVIDYNDRENIAKKLKGPEMELWEDGDFLVYMNQIPMSAVFADQNKNNADMGYAAVVEHQPEIKFDNHFVICAWDNDVLHDIVDHMTLLSTDDPAAA